MAEDGADGLGGKTAAKKGGGGVFHRAKMIVLIVLIVLVVSSRCRTWHGSFNILWWPPVQLRA